MAGFTRADVERGVDLVLRDKPELAKDPRIGDRDTLLSVLERYYNGYRFSKTGGGERCTIRRWCLYFFRELLSARRYYPDQMIDDERPHGLWAACISIAKAATEREGQCDTRELLEEDPNERIDYDTPLVEQIRNAKLRFDRSQVVSLFYYMGMLTFAPKMPQPMREPGARRFPTA